jgi:hypothetical protein
VFRDLGLAFAAVLVLIYILVTGWFQSFLIPLTIMSAIPFSLVGILPGHLAMGAFFTATSMIGFIAGVGIVVRNSIILVDFIQLRLNQGMPLDQAVIDVGAVRFRPMMLTGGRRYRWRWRHSFRPDFPGIGDFTDGGGSRLASVIPDDGTDTFLYQLQETSWERQASGPKLNLEDGHMPNRTSRFWLVQQKRRRAR